MYIISVGTNLQFLFSELQ